VATIPVAPMKFAVMLELVRFIALIFAFNTPFVAL
jgi:hypothetical protein